MITAMLARTGTMVHKSTVRRVLHSNPRLIYGTCKKPRLLSRAQKDERKVWCEDHIRNKTDWTKVVFVDEKRWTLDGPDGSTRTWYRRGEGAPARLRRMKGGGSIMVWGGFSATGKTAVEVIEENIDQDLYCKILQDELLGVGQLLAGESWKVLQDNAKPHVGKFALQWYAEMGIQRIQVPARSPDLNPMENLWAILTNSVYEGGRQYLTTQALEEAVVDAWCCSSEEQMRKLALSMQERCEGVVKANGGWIQY
jgi:hypothetical protein